MLKACKLTLWPLLHSIPSLSRLTLQQKEAELTRHLEQETSARSQLQEEVAAKDARLHELEVKVKTQRERTKSLTEQVSGVPLVNRFSGVRLFTHLSGHQ